MRFIPLLLLALPAAAAPWVRWVDRLGDIQQEEVVEFVEESTAGIRVRPRDGGDTRTIEAKRVLTASREDLSDPEQKALFDARFDVAAGVRLTEARATLDRLAGEGTRPWMREYAAAARVLLAERLRDDEKGIEMGERFLKERETSRFSGRVRRSIARMRARNVGEDFRAGMKYFKLAHDAIGERGPFLDRFGTLPDGALIMSYGDPDEFRVFMSSTTEVLSKNLDGARDFGAYVCFESAKQWAYLVQHVEQGRRIAQGGTAPILQMSEVKKLISESSLFLPELRSDLHREYGLLLSACGRGEEALKALRTAEEIAPDPGRKRAAQAALKAVGGK